MNPSLNNLAIFKQERYAHRKAVRHYHAKKTTENLHKLMSNPKNAYNFIKKSRRSKAGKINKLKVGAKTYSRDNVRFGFYESILQLKLKNNSSRSHHLSTFLEDYANIIDLCKAAPELEPISDVEALNILKRMMPDVLDSYNITPNHYLYAGPSGWKHFRLLLNALLSEVENVDIEEVNRAHAIVLFKGKGKDKSSSRSYRTISTCPVVAKAVDMIIRDRKLSSWNLDQSPTQFQGHGSSHELAAILLTECIQHSLHTTKRPLFALYLDAKSAFDVVRWELLIKNMYSIHGIDKSLLFIDKRLSCRQTVVEWDGHLLGPIKDEQGLEQGGVSSSDFYKIFGKEQLTLAQESSLGVPLLEQSSSSVVVSAIGQADDTVLLSNDIFSLFYLLELSSIFCTKYQVELCAEKTRLQRFLPRHWDPLSVQPNPVEINGTKIPFTNTAEHVGILRSSDGNGPSISARFSAHRRALLGVMQAGLSIRHQGNPTFSLWVEKLYATPVLLSGLSALVLTKAELKSIDAHYTTTLLRLLRLHDKTPRSVTLFLAGSLPATALLHMRQMGLFGMISRLEENNLLHVYAKEIFSTDRCSKSSWFR